MRNVVNKRWLAKPFLFLIFYGLFSPTLSSLAQEGVGQATANKGGNQEATTVFGPKRVREDTTPIVEDFSVADPPGECALSVDNGDQPLNRLSGALVTLNGVRTIGPGDLNKEVVHIERPVSLQQNNKIAIAVQGEPEAFIAVSLTCSLPEHVSPAAQDSTSLAAQASAPPAVQGQVRQVTQWWPYLEWTLPNPAYAGNPFDLEAEVIFTHQDSGAQIRTDMFYAGGNQWRFRFTGTRLGTWTFITHSADPDLRGHRGIVNVVEQSNPTLGRGFVTNAQAPFWTWSGNGKAFVPTLVMRTSGVRPYLEDPHRIDRDIEEFIKGHGFAGFHFFMPYTWFNAWAFSQEGVDSASSPNLNPDPQAFEVMEEIIKKTYQAGGFVHFWEWGKANNGSSAQALYGGVNGPVMQRQQRYFAARLGPVPGWTLGFGYDVWAEQNGADLKRWHAFYEQRLGWKHIIGARVHHNDEPVTKVMIDQLNYLGHEDHETIEYLERAYGRFVEWLETYPDTVHFSEDRFRICPLKWESRAFTPERLRRTLWHSGMAGGIAAIYGQCGPDGQLGPYGASYPFENKHELHTFATFFKSRLSTDLRRDDWLVVDGYGLISEDGARALAYIEETSMVALDLSGLRGTQPAVAIDTRRPYQEQTLGPLAADIHIWQAPYKSDWALAIGRFPAIDKPSAPRPR